MLPRSTDAPARSSSAAEPEERAKASTLCPLPSSSATTAVPMVPVPPVTKTFTMLSNQ